MDYPWYKKINDATLEQGDILKNCPVFLPVTGTLDEESLELEVAQEFRDVVVLSQSCDLVEGRDSISEVILCPIWTQDELEIGKKILTMKVVGK